MIFTSLFLDLFRFYVVVICFSHSKNIHFVCFQLLGLSYSDHKRDAARAENALSLSFGSELIGMQRDWNEELQSCREFPHKTPQERYILPNPSINVLS